MGRERREKGRMEGREEGKTRTTKLDRLKESQSTMLHYNRT